MNARLDLYRNIHKGIRMMLFDIVGKLGRVDFDDAAALDALRKEVRDIFELLESHAHTEDTFIMPLVQRVAAPLASTFAAAHEDQESQLPALLAELEAIDAADPAAPAKGHLVSVKISRIAGELMTHMADEELEINPAIWKATSDSEVHEVEQRLVASIPPEKMARYLRWMLPAMNGAERIVFLSNVRAGAPEPVFGFIRGLAAQVLTPAEDAALEEGLAASLVTA